MAKVFKLQIFPDTKSRYLLKLDLMNLCFYFVKKQFFKISVFNYLMSIKTGNLMFDGGLYENECQISEQIQCRLFDMCIDLYYSHS